MKKAFIISLCAVFFLQVLLTLSGCGTAEIQRESVIQTKTATETEVIPMKKTLKLFINGIDVPVTWQNTATLDALKELAEDGIEIKMTMYGGFEQVGPIGKSLPRSDARITTESGDIVLYSGDQIVIFYGSNTWSYTRLGHIDLSEREMADLLSHKSVAIELKYE